MSGLLASIAARALARAPARISLYSAAESAPTDEVTPASTSADGSKESTDLRRFDTTLPPDGATEAALAAAEAAAARAEATERTASELATKVARLRDLLAEREAVDDEGARLQRAVQRQEEEDSLKMIQLFRAQDEAFSAELAEAKAAVEEGTIVRMRQEADEAVGMVCPATLEPPPSMRARPAHGHKARREGER